MHDRDEDAGTYSLVELHAMAAAGDIDLIRLGTPEAATFDREMTAQLDEYNADVVERGGPDALTSDRQFRQAALAAEQDPTLAASALAARRAALVTDHAGLAAWLGMTPNGLAAPALEPRPDPAAAFADQVRRLAERFGADPDRLADALA